MSNRKTQSVALPLVSLQIKDLLLTVVFIAASALVPALWGHTQHNQIIVGSLVNFLLFFSAYRLRFANAALVAITPSSIALARGLLAPAMVSLLPFIIASNFLLIFIFSQFKKAHLGGVVFASFAKFAFLSACVMLLFIKTPLVSQTLGAIQLATALIGGILFYALIKSLPLKALS